MLHGTFDRDRVVPCAFLSLITRSDSFKILQGQRSFLHLLRRLITYTTGEDDLTTVDAGFRSDVDEQVGCLHDLFVMFHHDHSVANVSQSFQHRDKSLSVTRVKSDARLIENVKGTHERASESSHQVDALALTARKRIGSSVERQIAQTHIVYIFQS